MNTYAEGGRHIRQTPTVHILAQGFPLCGFSRKTPNKWPDKGKWVGRDGKRDATCPNCIKQELIHVNQNHPELKQGAEVWIMNISQSHGPSVTIDGKEYEPQTEFLPELEKAYTDLDWKTKRLGEVGYNYLGLPDGSVPVFISRCEFLDMQTYEEALLELHFRLNP